MSRVEKKLKSERGASITFALLLFLVCAVLCSVIITAASTASGRMARIAETDQRYYSVNSAAELLRSIIDGNTVSFVTEEIKKYKTTYTNGIAGDPEYIGDPVINEYVIDGTATPSTKLDDELSEPIEFDSIIKDAAYRVHTDGDKTRNLTLTTGLNTTLGIDYDAYAVSIKETLDDDGNMKLEISNKYAKNGSLSVPGNRYSLVLTFSLGKNPVSEADIDPEQYISSVERNNHDNSVAADGSVKYSTTTETTTKVIETYTWTLTEITNISSKDE